MKAKAKTKTPTVKPEAKSAVNIYSKPALKKAEGIRFKKGTTPAATMVAIANMTCRSDFIRYFEQCFEDGATSAGKLWDIITKTTKHAITQTFNDMLAEVLPLYRAESQKR